MSTLGVLPSLFIERLFNGGVEIWPRSFLTEQNTFTHYFTQSPFSLTIDATYKIKKISRTVNVDINCLHKQ